MRQKSITLRLPEEEYVAFTTVCNEKGYSQTGKIREFIRNMVKTEIGEVERGQYATFEEMKRDLARRQLAHNQNRERGAAGPLRPRTSSSAWSSALTVPSRSFVIK
jgi:hypothetical protein